MILFLRLKSSNQCNFTVEKLATNAVPQSNVDDHLVISCTFRAKNESVYNCPPLLGMQFNYMQSRQCGWCIEQCFLILHFQLQVCWFLKIDLMRQSFELRVLRWQRTLTTVKRTIYYSCSWDGICMKLKYLVEVCIYNMTFIYNVLIFLQQKHIYFTTLESISSFLI